MSDLEINISVSITASAGDGPSIQKLQAFIDKAKAMGFDPTASLDVKVVNSYSDPRPGESTPGSFTLTANC